MKTFRILLFAILTTFLFSQCTRVEDGTRKVKRTFGKKITKMILEPGFYSINPLATYKKFNIKRQEFTVITDDSSGTKFLTKKGVELEAEIEFPYRLNEKYLPEIWKYLGSEPEAYSKPVAASAYSSLRLSAAELTWREAAISEREKFATLLKSNMQASLSLDLVASGFPDSIAGHAFILGEPIIKETRPPERIAQEVNEEEAAKTREGRQKILTRIADEEANRMVKEGQGINMLLNQMPTSSTKHELSDISKLIRANAMRTQSDALMKAVESGQVDEITFTMLNPADSN